MENLQFAVCYNIYAKFICLLYLIILMNILADSSIYTMYII